MVCLLVGTITDATAVGVTLAARADIRQTTVWRTFAETPPSVSVVR